MLSLKKIDPKDILPEGSKVIHTSTLEVGTYLGEGLNPAVCRVKYSTGEYPQPKRTIMQIITQE
jgi:hypothetical protein